MEKQKTKQRILDAALELFSTQGFEATSIAQIADAVGVRKASLYSHFDSKQDILDRLIESIMEDYAKHSVRSPANHIGDELDPDGVVRLVTEQIRYIVHDEHVSRARKMLTIEQYRNPQLAELKTKQRGAHGTACFRGQAQAARYADDGGAVCVSDIGVDVALRP